MACKRYKETLESSRAKNREKRLRAYKANSNKFKARRKVEYALKTGKLTRPNVCPVCGIVGFIHAHHSSYKKDSWLMVTWLCSTCHGKAHRYVKHNLEKV